MSKFIELTDYDASIHREILDAVTREDNAVVEICEDRAIAEMRCYLSKRYDCDRIFTASVDGLPLLPEETRAARSNFLIKSNRKRINHW